MLRSPLFDAQRPEGDGIRQRHVAQEPYVAGESLYRDLARIVARRGWTIGQLAAWAHPWLHLLGELAHGEGRKSDEAPADVSRIDPSLFDCTPFNVIRRASDGKLVAFDLEWEAAGGHDLTVAEVAFRGLWNCLVRLEEVAPPAAEVAQDIASIVAATLERRGIAASPAQLHAWIESEYAFTGAVSGSMHGVPSLLPRLRVRGERLEHLAARVVQLERELEVNRFRLFDSLRQASHESGRGSQLAERIAELESLAHREHAEVERLDAILRGVEHRFVSRLGVMLAPYPRLGAVLRAPLHLLHRLFRTPPA